ncbi:hypothetical protein TNCT_278791 [Trichonephila clavata]|uniref:Uncharacterized protein n=1 Tax=Trichonephila clavata TaxID=2740835 RepID=A0A8X6GAI2_TRICU|nr:hypothetical protein TNCT_278791 [Trichonephila clavata]
MGNNMELCSKNVEETVERGIQRTNHGKEASPWEFYPMNPIQRGTCLKTHVSFQGHRSNGETPRGKLQKVNLKKETQRGLGKHGNILPLTNVGRFDVEIYCCR